MAIPSVNLFANQPGGGLTFARGGVNALANNRALRKYNEAKAEYAPMSLRSEAASKLAYANLMGPQFLAKAMQDPYFMGNLSEEQKAEIARIVHAAGTGQGTGNAILNLPNTPQSNQPHSTGFINALKNIFGIGSPQPQAQNNNAFNMPPQQPQPQAQPQPQLPQSQQGQMIDEMGNPVDEHGDSLPTPVTEEEAAALQANNDLGNPSSKPIKITVRTGNKAPIPPGTYETKGGKYAGTFEEEKEAGKIRAKDREALNNTAFNAETNQGTLNQISDILASNAFAEIRRNPIAGHHELAYYALEGTPEQKEMIGQYYTLTGNLIKDASRDFAGQFRKGEQTLLNGMKPGPKDTVDTAKGKTEALSVLNRMLAARAKMTSQIMAQHHVDKLKASEAADKMIDGAKIRQEVHDRLYPTVTLEDPNRPGITITLPILEARKRGYKDEE